MRRDASEILVLSTELILSQATYSGIPVYEMYVCVNAGNITRSRFLNASRIVKGVAVMRRRSDSWLNATQILKVAGFDKPQRTRVLEREVQKGEHEKVQGGYGKYQGKSTLRFRLPFDLSSHLLDRYLDSAFPWPRTREAIQLRAPVTANYRLSARSQESSSRAEAHRGRKYGEEGQTYPSGRDYRQRQRYRHATQRYGCIEVTYALRTLFKLAVAFTHPE